MSVLHSFNIKCEYANAGCYKVEKLENLINHRTKCDFNGLAAPSAPCEVRYDDENRQLVTNILDDIFDLLTQQPTNRTEGQNEEEQQ